ncbi:MAG: hypothetical protein ACK4N5_07830, partial [Myxococcales bacterium]
MARLSALTIAIEANIAKLRTGLDEANRHLAGFSKKAERVAQGFAAAFAAKASIGGLSAMVKQGADTADAMAKLSQSLGMTVEQISQLDYAAGFAGLSTEAFSGAMQQLGRTMGEAAVGSADQVALFEALGVKLRGADGAIRNTGEVLKDLADKFAGMEGGVSKAALAQEVFGKSGASLIPLLNGGSAGLAAMAAEADRFGATVTEQGARAAEEFNDALTRLEKQSAAVGLRLAQDLAPTLTAVANAIGKTSAESGILSEVAKGLALVFRSLLMAGRFLLWVLEHLAVTAAGLASIFWGRLTEGSEEAGKRFQAVAEELRHRMRSMNQQMMSLAGADLPKPLEEQAKAATENADKIREVQKKLADDTKRREAERAAATRKAVEQQKQAIQSLEKMAEKAVLDFETFGMSDLDVLKHRFERGDLSKTVKQAGKKGEVSRDTILFAEQEKAFKAREQEVKRALDEANRSRVRAQDDLGLDLAARSTNAARSGMAPDQLFADLTRGFDSFNHAMAEYERLRLAAIQKIHDAEMARAAKNEEGALAAERAARSLNVLAEKAGEAADAHAAQAARQAKAKDDANAGMGDSLMGGLGAVGSVINSFKSAMEKTGDVFTALGAALLAIVMQSESFQRLVGVLNDALGGVADAIGVLIEPLIPAFKFAGQMLVLLAQAVMPFLVGGSDFQQVFNSVAPMLQILVELLVGFMPIIEMVGKAFLLVTNPLILLGYALKPFFGVVRDVAAWMLQGAIAAAEWWNLAMYTLKGIFNRFINVVAGAIGEGDITRAMRSF